MKDKFCIYIHFTVDIISGHLEHSCHIFGHPEMSKCTYNISYINEENNGTSTYLLLYEYSSIHNVPKVLNILSFKVCNHLPVSLYYTATYIGLNRLQKQSLCEVQLRLKIKFALKNHLRRSLPLFNQLDFC